MSYFGKIEFNQLSPSEQAIYSYIRSNTEKIQYMRVREIASESHTSPASVMRFIKKIGFDSYAEFKAKYKLEYYEQPIGIEMIPEVFKETFPNDIETRLVSVAEELMTSDNVIVFGIGSSGFLCDIAARRCAILGINATSITDHTYPIKNKMQFSSDNIVIIISTSGETTEVLEIASEVKTNADCKLISITTREDSSLGKMSHTVLPYRIRERRVRYHESLSTQLPALYLIETLTDYIHNLSNEN